MIRRGSSKGRKRAAVKVSRRPATSAAQPCSFTSASAPARRLRLLHVDFNLRPHDPRMGGTGHDEEAGKEQHNNARRRKAGEGTKGRARGRRRYTRGKGKAIRVATGVLVVDPAKPRKPWNIPPEGHTQNKHRQFGIQSEANLSRRVVVNESAMDTAGNSRITSEKRRGETQNHTKRGKMEEATRKPVTKAKIEGKRGSEVLLGRPGETAGLQQKAKKARENGKKRKIEKKIGNCTCERAMD